MTNVIIITVCALLLIAYLFDLTSAKTKIPSAILLLALGWIVRQLTGLTGITLPDLSGILPILGTIGLILIVLEASLELELDRSKIGIINKSFWVALIPLAILAFLLAFLFHYFGNYSFKDSLTNAIPFCIISSAIAIPSTRMLPQMGREFVIYESSFSDILGVLFFNFVALNNTFNLNTYGHFGLQLIVMILISFIATVALALLLGKIEHHIKFAPIILLVILIYAIAKQYHLPSLIFILIFGLFVGGLDILKQFRWIRRLKLDDLNEEIHKFRELTSEATFLIRALFFLLFGYLIETAEILNPKTLIWAAIIVGGIFGLRIVLLKLFRLPLKPLVFVAPRGLITILLFLSIEPGQSILLVNKSLIIQVIIITALVMMYGLMTKKKQPEIETEAEAEIEAEIEVE